MCTVVLLGPLYTHNITRVLRGPSLGVEEPVCHFSLEEVPSQTGQMASFDLVLSGVSLGRMNHGVEAELVFNTTPSPAPT